MENDILITEAPPYRHELSNVYEAIGFDNEKQAKYLSVDCEDEVNKYFRENHPNTSRGVEYIEKRIMSSWKERRIFIAAYLEMLRQGGLLRTKPIGGE